MNCRLCKKDINGDPQYLGHVELCNVCSDAIDEGDINKLKRHLESPFDIPICYIITNGEPCDETIKGYTDEGYIMVKAYTAKDFHPYALEGDRLTIFANPINKDEYDSNIGRKKLYEYGYN